MLPLAERLKRSNLFTKAYGARKMVSTPFFTLYVLPRIPKVKPDAKQLILPMTGFVVSKKVSKSAVRRNRMKRRTREAYRALRTQSQNQWYVMVLVIKENVLNASWADLCRTMEVAFGEAAQKYGR